MLQMQPDNAAGRIGSLKTILDLFNLVFKNFQNYKNLKLRIPCIVSQSYPLRRDLQFAKTLIKIP